MKLYLYIGAGVLIGLVILVLLWFVTEPGRERDKAEKAQVESSVSNAAAGAGQEAVNAVSNNAQEKASVDARVKEGENAIRQADPSELDSVTRRELCKSPSYHNTAACLQSARSR